MWSSLIDIEIQILIDSDVIRHFIRGRELDRLGDIFPNRIRILDMVESEICRSSKIRPDVERIIDEGIIQRMQFPTGSRFIVEYGLLSQSFGTGEAACMAVARHSEKIIASNNLRDITQYCIEHQICYLTTLDILYVAYRNGVMDAAEVDLFLYYNRSGLNPSRIPFETLQEYIDSEPTIELSYRIAG
jgi:hypothetical protein